MTRISKLGLVSMMVAAIIPSGVQEPMSFIPPTHTPPAQTKRNNATARQDLAKVRRTKRRRNRGW